MAIYHLTVKIIGRNEGRSSVAAAAYRSGDVLTNEWDGQTHDYSRKGWIEYSEIMLPANAPESFKDRSTLWNAVESSEKSGNAQLAREVEIALPMELTLEQQTALLRAYIEQNFILNGICVDFAIHNSPVTDGHSRPVDIDGNPTNDHSKMIFRNPHAHIMLTMRPLDEKGKWQPKAQHSYLCRKNNQEKTIPATEIKEAESEGWKKQYHYQIGKKKIWLTAESAEKRGLKRIDKQPKSAKIQNPITAKWNSKDSLYQWRESWASMCNQALSENNIEQYIDHRSYESCGINKVPQVHMGVEAYQMEKKGIHTELGDLNREVKESNLFLSQFKAQIDKLEQAETERLHELSSRLEGLRVRYIATAYQQLMISMAIANEKDQLRTQLQLAATYAKASEQILRILESLERGYELKQRELALVSPLQAKKRKALEAEIIDTEQQIQALKDRLGNLTAAYKPNPTSSTSQPEVLEQKQKQKQKHIQNLKEIESQTYKEFYTLVNENKESMKKLRELIKGKRSTYDNYVQEKLQEHFAEKFQNSILMKAREGAPDLPELDGAGLHQTKSHRH